MMLFFILVVITLIYLSSIAVARERKFGINLIRILRIIIFIATPLLLTILIAEMYNIYPGEYWLKKGIFWLVIFSCMLAFGLCKREFFGVFERVIYKTIFYLPLVFVLFLLVPFIGIGYGLIFYVKFIGDDKFILYNDDKIRIEQPSIRFMGPNPQPVLYVKQKLVSYRDTVLPLSYDEQKDSVEVKKLSDSTYTIVIKSPGNWQVPTGIESFTYNLRQEPK